MTERPYGSWRSPVTAELIVSSTIGLGSPIPDGDDVYWLEGRPMEGGRQVLVRRRPDGSTADITPAPYNVRTRVHEYGGGSFAVRDGHAYFVNFADQHLYHVAPGGSPEALVGTGGLRFADFAIDKRRRLLFAVREDHTGGGEAVNTVISISLDSGELSLVAQGHDFFSTPRLSPDGRKLCWLSWDHPNMPWDGTHLWLADLDESGAPRDARRVAGGDQESIFQPEWSPDGRLYFVSDGSGWWNLYRLSSWGVEPILEMAAEFGAPQWAFDTRTYGFLDDGRIFASYVEGGRPKTGIIDPDRHALTPLSLQVATGGIRTSGRTAYFGGSSPALPGALYRFDAESGALEALRWTTELRLDERYISVAEPIEFPTEGGKTAYAYYYPPVNPDFAAPPGEKPPLIVMSHGGPTAATGSSLSLQKQFWTSRGFAVLDVNYGGSTGYGREYRRRLDDWWGVVDVDDCVNGATYLAQRGLVDAERMAITGGSAGGYTTLCALTFRDVFRAGASYYGVGDLEALARDTHKFESRYLDRLVGPYPGRRDLYIERSPIHHVDKLSCPVIFFQGLEDRIVPPNQTDEMVAALRSKGVPVAYLAFEGEQHGFRKAENIKRSLEAELYFYGRIFGFEPADQIEPVEIENL
jgi:dipeptidyl aminopeptidase/acylaminoacyl peptidase